MYRNLMLGALVCATLSTSAASYLRNAECQPGNDKEAPAHWKLRDTRVKKELPPRAADCPAVTAADGAVTLDTDGGRSEVMLIQFELPLKRGAEYAFTCEVMGEGQVSSRAILYWQTAGPEGKRVWRHTDGSWQPVSNEWQERTVTVKLPADSSSPYLVLAASGPGKLKLRKLNLRDHTLTLEGNSELGVYAPGEAIEYRALFKKAPEHRLRYRVTDFRDTEVAAGEVKGNDPIAPAGLPLGWFALQADEVNAAGETVVTLRTAFTVIPEVPASLQSAPGNQYGVMVNPHTFYPFEQKERDVRYAARIGVRYLRTHRLSWGRIQSGPEAAYDWREADREIELYRKHGIKAVATIGWPVPRWATNLPADTPNKNNYFPEDRYLPALKNFYRELAARYGDAVAYYEVGNEVDASNFWLGRYAHANAGDNAAIFRDFIEFYTVVASGVLAGNPKAMIGPGTTGSMPKGHTYQPWLATFWSSPEALQYTTIFCPHYKADLTVIREVMAKHGKVVPIVLTEIGGLVRTENYEITPAILRQLIKRTYSQYTAQLNAGGLALCKFLLRQIPEVREGWVSEMLGADNSIRPEYAAYATLIRLTANGRFDHELNITRHASAGWLEGYRVERPEGPVNILMLNDAERAIVRLETASKALRLMDVMGNEQPLPVKDGKVEFEMTEDQPLFLFGDLKEAAGPVKHPEPELVAKRTLTLTNPGFEEVAANRIPGWGKVIDENAGAGGSASFTVNSDDSTFSEGKRSLRMAAETRTRWYGVLTHLPMAEIPALKTGEFLIFKVYYDQKITGVEGTGAGVTLAFRAADMKRVSWGDGNWVRGTTGWISRSWERRVEDALPRGTEKITLEFYLGMGTGEVNLDNIRVEVEHYRKSNAASQYIN